MAKVELEFMPKAQKWRIRVDGKAIPRRFSNRLAALKEFERIKKGEEMINGKGKDYI